MLQSKVTVHTIAITDQADLKMDALGSATGGLSFIHRDDEQGNDLDTAFTEIAKFESSMYSCRHYKKNYTLKLGVVILTQKLTLFG